MTTSFIKAMTATATAVAIAGLAACSNMGMGSGMMMGGLKLSGSQEVPPVSTMAAGTGSIKVEPEGAVSGSVTTTGMVGTMAHIHMGAVGVNGPVIVPLVQMSEGVWSVPRGTMLTTEQRKSYLDGNLYVNVHTATNKGGEIRAQLKP